MHKLPIGIQTFKNIIEDNYLYIDKTEEAFNLINSYKYIFLSRPRRFGKSLFLDTIKNIFEGKKELFKGLYIYDKWDWSVNYPVIKISWGGYFKSLKDTEDTAMIFMRENLERHDIECSSQTPAGCLRELIRGCYKKYNQKVVVLIDEYDKPILDNMDDIRRANENRDFLRGVYVQIKESDEFIKFVFVTGISKFSKASIFSGFNNLEDISLNPNFGNICGYTHENIKNEFYEYSKDFELEKIKEWYNGYYFLKERIYNPFDILKLFKYRMFKNYWWESGQAYSLIEILKKGDYYIPELENLVVSEDMLNSFDIENLKLEVLLYQAGYLTIEESFINFDDTIGYRLKVPNKEVQISLNKLIIEYLTDHVDERKRESLFLALRDGYMDSFKRDLESLFASIPYNNYVKNNIGEYEGYYASVVYAYLASLGIKIIAEDVTNRGRLDMTLFISDKIYCIEFKVGSNNALKQIKEMGYYKKYINDNKDIYLIGIAFDGESRNISSFEWERVEDSL